MASQLFLLPFRPALDANAIIVPGAKLYFYATGTTTLQSVYADEALTTPLANPLEADAAGAWPVIYLDQSKIYRVLMKDKDGNTLPNSEVDPYVPGVVDALAPQVAQDAADAAQSAALASMMALAIQLLAAGLIFETAADGVDPGTGVADGEYYCVAAPVGDPDYGRLFLYRNDAGTPVQMAEFVTDALISLTYAKLADLASAASGKGADLVGLSHSTSYNNGTLGAHLKAFVVASDAPFNVRGDDSTDNAAGINAALAHCHSLGGGDVLLPGGKIRASATIDNKYPRVRLVGRGFDYAHDSGTVSATRTVLKATHSGTVLKIRTPYAAEQGVSASATQKYWGAGAVGFTIDCNSIATKACEIDSVSGVEVKLFASGCVGTTCFEVKTGVTGTDLGEACDVQHSSIWVAARLIDSTAEKSCHICTLSGSINANVSLNRAPASGIFVGGQHWDGHAVLGGCADNNDITIAAYRAGGSGRPLYAKGPTVAIPVGFDSNCIRYLASAGTAYAEGTDTAGVTGGILNTIEHLDRGNGTPTPTTGTGSYWEFHGTDGVDVGKAFNKVVIADSDPNAKAERANLGSTSLLIRNGSGAHVLLTDGSNSWSVALDSADVRIARLAGTGAVNVGNGAPVKIGNKLVTEGAADSGGTGFRVLRVPN